MRIIHGVVCNNSLLLLDGARVKRRIFGPEARVPPIDMDRSMRSRRWRSTPPVAKRPATTSSTLLTNHRSIVFLSVERRLSLLTFLATGNDRPGVLRRIGFSLFCFYARAMSPVCRFYAVPLVGQNIMLRAHRSI